MFLEHVHYLDRIDISTIAKGVKNSLHRNILFWENIDANEFVLKTIKNGYVIPFLNNPPPMFFRNNNSALVHSDFVNEAISELVNNGCVIEIPFQPFVVNPLSVSVNSSGKKRLILDLSELNVFIKKEKVKFEDWRVALNYFTKGCFLFKFDLKSGYYHFDICTQHQTYLGFLWRENFYCFTVLAFGLTSAPFLFTKCLRPIVKYWRKNGVNIVLYLDDGLGMANNKLQCEHHSQFVEKSLSDAGFLVNKEKSIFEPVQVIEWLGLIWNSLDFSISIPDRRLQDAKSSLTDLLNVFPNFTARQLARVTGKIISMSPVMGNITSLMTRHLYMAIEKRKRWDLFLELEFPDFVGSELNFWLQNILKLKSKSLVKYSLPHVLVYSDASNIAAGAYSVGVDENIFHRMWSSDEVLMSSTWRELKAICLAIMSFRFKLANNNIKWHTDNKNCVSIIEKGSTKLHLQNIAVQIFNLCTELSIS